MNRTRRYITDYPCLNLTSITKKGLVVTGQQGQSSSTLRATQRLLWSFSWQINSDSIEVHYQIKEGIHQGAHSHQIKLAKQSVNFGNQRLYLICSQCDRMCKQIYFRCGIDACRVCHNLHYQSQSESKGERRYRKLDRLLKKVHNFGYRFDGHWKAKGQHWKTFHKIDNEICTIQQSILRDIDKRFGLSEWKRHFSDTK